MNTVRKPDIQAAVKHWPYVARLTRIPCNEREYDELVAALNMLLDLGGCNEKNQIASLVELIGSHIEAYEQKHDKKLFGKKTSTIDVLKFLMEQHNLTQSELPEIGAQSVVSAILHGKRKLNARQILALSKRFNVSADLFLE